MADTGTGRRGRQTPAPPARRSWSSTPRPPPAQRRRARRPRVGAGVRRRRPDRSRDRPPRAGDGPAPGLRGDGRQHPAATRSRPGLPPELRRPTGRAAIVRPMDGVVLVLNQNYEPLNVCNIPRAFRLVFGSKAEVIEYDHAEIRTVRTGLPRARR